MNAKNENWSSKRVTIIGAGVSGTALALLARRLGAEVFVSEGRPELPLDVTESLRESGATWETGGHTDRAFDAGGQHVDAIANGRDP